MVKIKSETISSDIKLEAINTFKSAFPLARSRFRKIYSAFNHQLRLDFPYLLEHDYDKCKKEIDSFLWLCFSIMENGAIVNKRLIESYLKNKVINENNILFLIKLVATYKNAAFLAGLKKLTKSIYSEK